MSGGYIPEHAAWNPLIEFTGFGKIPRLYRDMVITEKIDGTNAAVGIILPGPAAAGHPDLDAPCVKIGKYDDGTQYAIYAQSRRRLIAPQDDNYGFAGWVHGNSDTLARDLGPGLHFGEWWGNGIQRGYGQSHKIFSLFNTHRWGQAAEFFETENLRTVPVLTKFTFDSSVVADAVAALALNGSCAAPGFMNPEGIVVFHTAAGVMFKATIENDSSPKSLT